MSAYKYRKCFFKCNDTEGGLHRFPNPDKNIERFNIWVKVLDVETKKKDPLYIYNNVRLCNKHFEDYYRTPSGLLTRNAYPTLNIYINPRDSIAADEVNTVEDCTLYDDSDEEIEIVLEESDELHEGFCCNFCKGVIKRYRYTCIQCNDFDICKQCEMKGLHSRHYVLRIPTPKPFAEIQAVIKAIRKYLMNENEDEEIQLVEDESTSAEITEETVANSKVSHCDADPLRYSEREIKIFEDIETSYYDVDCHSPDVIYRDLTDVNKSPDNLVTVTEEKSVVNFEEKSPNRNTTNCDSNIMDLTLEQEYEDQMFRNTESISQTVNFKHRLPPRKIYTKKRKQSSNILHRDDQDNKRKFNTEKEVSGLNSDKDNFSAQNLSSDEDIRIVT